MSSGAAMLAALRTAEKMESGNIVVVFPDRAEKYLSTTMFEPFAD
jgi:cysteine synthase B